MNTATLDPSAIVEIPAVAHKVHLPIGRPGIFVIPDNVPAKERAFVASCLSENIGALAGILAHWRGDAGNAAAIAWSITYLTGFVHALAESLEDEA